MNNKKNFFQMAVKEVSAADKDGAITISGLASTPQLDRYRDIVEPKAFEASLIQYMSNPVVLRSHDPDRPIGTVVEAKVTDQGLWIKALIKDEKTKKDIQDGVMRTFSIGYIPTKTELHNKDNEPIGVEDSPWDMNNIRVIKELDLVEISVVSTPANPGALFSLSKSLKLFGRQLALKSFGSSADENSNIPQNEIKDAADDEEVDKEEEPKDEDAKAVGDACTLDDGGSGIWQEGEDGTMVCMPVSTEDSADAEKDVAAAVDTKDAEAAAEVEKPVEHEGAADETQKKDVEETKPQDGAENAGETTANDATASDAKPTSGEEEKVIVTKEVGDLMPELIAAGAVFVATTEQKALSLPKSVTELLRTLAVAVTIANDRANELQSKLDGTPEKKVLSRQFAADAGEEDQIAPAAVSAKKENSAAFKQMFPMFFSKKN